MTIPKEIRGQKYISLATFRKSGQAVNTPVWFAEYDEKLYVMTRSDSGKYKRIRNNPQVRIARSRWAAKSQGWNFPQPRGFFRLNGGRRRSRRCIANTGSRGFRFGARRTSFWRLRLLRDLQVKVFHVVKPIRRFGNFDKS
jgi:hypothetical protein